jgi:hypothetical protein
LGSSEPHREDEDQGEPLTPSAISIRISGEKRTMASVTCTIKSKKTPERWIEVEIGVDGSGEDFWRLTAKSPVAFPHFIATVGRWDPIPYYGGKPSGPYWGVPSIVLISGDPDPVGGFVLFPVEPSFYRLGCGQTLRGEGAREETADVTFRMDFLCV